MEMSIRPQDDPELISEFSTNLPCKRRNFWFLAIRCSQVTGLQTEANFLKGRIGELQARHMVPVWWNFHLDRTHQTNYLLTHYLFVRKNARGCGWGFLGVRALAHFIRYHILPQCFLPKRAFHLRLLRVFLPSLIFTFFNFSHHEPFYLVLGFWYTQLSAYFLVVVFALNIDLVYKAVSQGVVIISLILHGFFGYCEKRRIPLRENQHEFNIH